jgi:hypothetical protein
MIERFSAMQKRASFADEPLMKPPMKPPMKQRQNNPGHRLTPGISRAYA